MTVTLTHGQWAMLWQLDGYLQGMIGEQAKKFALKNETLDLHKMERVLGDLLPGEWAP